MTLCHRVRSFNHILGFAFSVSATPSIKALTHDERTGC